MLNLHKNTKRYLVKKVQQYGMKLTILAVAVVNYFNGRAHFGLYFFTMKLFKNPTLYLIFHAFFIFWDINSFVHAKVLPDIIILNGSSNAGKSSLAKSLQGLLKNYLVVSYDSFREFYLIPKAKELELIPSDYIFKTIPIFFDDIKNFLEENDASTKAGKTTLWNSIIDSFDEKFYEHIATLALEEKKIIVDAIIFKKEQIKYIKRLPQDKLSVVFVHIPLEHMIARINKRNSSGNIKEFRYINRILFYYPFYYRIKPKNSGDFTIETTVSAIHETVSCAACLPCLSPRFKNGSPLSEHILKAWELRDRSPQEKIFLVPRLTYDCCVDTEKYSPEDAALEIITVLGKKNSPSSLFATDAEEIINSLL